MNGIIIFDDYTWNVGERSPKKAIDKFLQDYAQYLQVLLVDYQVIVKKIAHYL